MNTQHARNIDKWLTYITANNLKKNQLWTSADKILLKLKVEKSPVVFWSYSAMSFAIGSYFGIFWGASMYVFSWRRSQMSVGVMLIAAIFAGTMFGLSMGWLLLREKKKLGLTTWEEFLSRNP